MLFVTIASEDECQALRDLTRQAAGRVALRALMVLWSAERITVAEIAALPLSYEFNREGRTSPSSLQQVRRWPHSTAALIAAAYITSGARATTILVFSSPPSLFTRCRTTRLHTSFPIVRSVQPFAPLTIRLPGPLQNPCRLPRFDV
jgi:hypothetical protein